MINFSETVYFEKFKREVSDLVRLLNYKEQIFKPAICKCSKWKVKIATRHFLNALKINKNWNEMCASYKTRFAALTHWHDWMVDIEQDHLNLSKFVCYAVCSNVMVLMCSFVAFLQFLFTVFGFAKISFHSNKILIFQFINTHARKFIIHHRHRLKK